MALKVWLPLIKNLNNQGTYINNPTTTGATVSTSGLLGGSYYFDGTNDQIQTTYPCAEANMTVCMWATFTKLSVHLLDMRNQSGVGYQPAYVGSSGVQVGGSNSAYTYINFVPTLNTWYHLAIVYSATKVQLYVNGAFYGETTSSKGYNFNTTMEVHIGSRYSGAYWFGGNVADFRIYNEALSAYEIRKIAQGLLLHYTRPATNIISVGSTVNDSSGFGRHATIFNSDFGVASNSQHRYLYSYTTFAFGSATSGYLSTTSPSSGVKTISFWLASPKTATTVFFADYKSKLAFGYNGSGYIIASCDSFSTKMFDASSITSLVSAHIVIRKNASNNDVDLFINGEAITTRYSNNYWTHSTDTLMIGQRSIGTPMPNALFSDFRMYATRLSDEDIMDLYKTQLKQFSGGKSSPFELYEDTVGKVQVQKTGRLINNSFVESTSGNKFKGTQAISNEFIER